MTAEILRLVAGGLLALICCYGGVLIKRHYADREKFYTEAEAFAAYLSSELGFRKTPLPALIAQFAEDRKGSFAAMIKRFGAGLSLGAAQDKAAAEARKARNSDPTKKSR